MIEMKDAYSTAIASANSNDDALEEKKKAIEERLQTVTKKMRKLKDNAIQIQKDVNKMLTETLEELHIIV